jgi:hypothetical protein
MPPVTVRVVARGPVKSKGPEAINRQLDTFKAAIERSGAKVTEAIIADVERYQSGEEHLDGSCAMRSGTAPHWKSACAPRPTTMPRQREP